MIGKKEMTLNDFHNLRFYFGLIKIVHAITITLRTGSSLLFV